MCVSVFEEWRPRVTTTSFLKFSTVWVLCLYVATSALRSTFKPVQWLPYLFNVFPKNKPWKIGLRAKVITHILIYFFSVRQIFYYLRLLVGTYCVNILYGGFKIAFIAVIYNVLFKHDYGLHVNYFYSWNQVVLSKNYGWVIKYNGLETHYIYFKYLL